jgi:hypothetical protein
MGTRLSRASRDARLEDAARDDATSFIARRRLTARERVDHAHGGASKD